MWCIPPKASAEFVCHMEDVLAVYHRPYDAKRPVVCLDETFKQLIGDVREPLAAAPGSPAKFDSVYQRNGVASVFMAFEPLAGWRHAEVTDGRTAKDWAHVVKALLDGRYKDAEKLVLVMDQLNTHALASLYVAFEPAEARRLAARLEVHHTPKHGSWLNVAEVELSVFGRRLPDRVGDAAGLTAACAAHERERNASGAGVNWRFTTDDARIKLGRLYPSIEVS